MDTVSERAYTGSEDTWTIVNEGNLHGHRVSEEAYTGVVSEEDRRGHSF